MKKNRIPAMKFWTRLENIWTKRQKKKSGRFLKALFGKKFPSTFLPFLIRSSHSTLEFSTGDVPTRKNRQFRQVRCWTSSISRVSSENRKRSEFSRLAEVSRETGPSKWRLIWILSTKGLASEENSPAIATGCGFVPSRLIGEVFPAAPIQREFPGGKWFRRKKAGALLKFIATRP